MEKEVYYEEMLEKAVEIEDKPESVIQLQDMVLPYYGEKKKLQKFNLWVEFQNIYNWSKFFHEKEYWLAFFMCLNFNKVWYNEEKDWIYISTLPDNKRVELEFATEGLLF